MAYNAIAMSGTSLRGDDGNNLYSIDAGSGVSTLIGGHAITNRSAFSIDNNWTWFTSKGAVSNGNLYVIGFIAGGPSSLWLGQENLLDGSITVLGSLLNYSGCNGFIQAIGSLGNSLYLASTAVSTTAGFGGTCNNGAQAAGQESLYRLNPSTGAMTYIGNTGLTSGNAKNFFSSGGVLYLIDNSSPSKIYAVNTGTGTSTLAQTLATTIKSASSPVASPTPISNTALVTLAGLLAVAGWWMLEQRQRA